MSKPMTQLAVIGALAVNFLGTTHGNDLGHDHHCPVPYSQEAPTARDKERCTCGWATFYGAYLDLIGTKAEATA